MVRERWCAAIRARGLRPITPPELAHIIIVLSRIPVDAVVVHAVDAADRSLLSALSLRCVLPPTLVVADDATSIVLRIQAAQAAVGDASPDQVARGVLRLLATSSLGSTSLLPLRPGPAIKWIHRARRSRRLATADERTPAAR